MNTYNMTIQVISFLKYFTPLQKLIKQFEDSLKEKAIDCEIFYEGNNYEDEEPIKCEI